MKSREGMHFSRLQSAKDDRVLLESPKDVLLAGREAASTAAAAAYCLAMDNPVSMCSPASERSPAHEFWLDSRWLIDANLLLVGPRIGEGAHGKVYEGQFRDQSVAVKIVQPGGTPEEVAKREARFAREISLLQRVQHKNLVKFIGACKEPAMVVVTELLQGGSLRKYLMSMRPKRLDIRLAVGFALDIAHAMDCLHNHGIIHRDLKPDNLLLTADQKTVELVDFGLAREETLTEMMTAETGTYRWMAPELYSTVTLRHGEKKHYNHKVDVYSFSIVLWELLTNRMPFEGMSNLQAAYAAAFKGTRPNLSENLNLPEELVFIMQSCWAEDPNVRPNFAQVIRMLNSYLSTIPTPVNPALQLQMVSKSMPVSKKLLSTSTSKDKEGEKIGGSSHNLVNKSKGGLSVCFGQCFVAETGDSLM